MNTLEGFIDSDQFPASEQVESQPRRDGARKGRGCQDSAREHSRSGHQCRQAGNHDKDTNLQVSKRKTNRVVDAVVKTVTSLTEEPLPRDKNQIISGIEFVTPDQSVGSTQDGQTAYPSGITSSFQRGWASSISSQLFQVEAPQPADEIAGPAKRGRGRPRREAQLLRMTEAANYKKTAPMPPSGEAKVLPAVRKLADTLAEARTALLWTQDECARVLGVSQSKVAQLENLRTTGSLFDRPSSDHIAEKLRIDPDYLWSLREKARSAMLAYNADQRLERRRQRLQAPPKPFAQPVSETNMAENVPPALYLRLVPLEKELLAILDDPEQSETFSRVVHSLAKGASPRPD